MSVLCLVEHDLQGVAGLSLQALTFARSLPGPWSAVVVGEPVAATVSALRQQGVSVVHVADADALQPYAARAWARTLEQLVGATAADVVVAPGSDRGHEVLAHLASLTDLPMAAGCLTARRDGPDVALSRIRWAGSLLEDAVLQAPVALLAVAPQLVAATAAESPGEARLEPYLPLLGTDDLREQLVSSTERDVGAVSLTDARVVVGGGRGVGGPEGFAVLEELAGLLGGTVGVSRVATSLGWRPHHDQVGQTGTRIAPELYLACGISGAIQHMAGCKSAKRLLAVNSDPDAPIMRAADYVVVGDLHQVLPALVAALRSAAG